MYNDLQTLFKHSSLFQTFGDFLTDEHRSSICKVSHQHAGFFTGLGIENWD